MKRCRDLESLRRRPVLSETLRKSISTNLTQHAGAGSPPASKKSMDTMKKAQRAAKEKTSSDFEKPLLQARPGQDEDFELGGWRITSYRSGRHRTHDSNMHASFSWHITCTSVLLVADSRAAKFTGAYVICIAFRLESCVRRRPEAARA